MTDPQGAWSVGTRRHPGEGHGRRLEWPDTVRCGRGAGGGKSGNGCRAWARPIRMRDVCLARREWRGRVGAGVCVAVSCATSAPRPLRWCPVVSGETIPCFARIAALLYDYIWARHCHFAHWGGGDSESSGHWGRAGLRNHTAHGPVPRRIVTIGELSLTLRT